MIRARELFLLDSQFDVEVQYLPGQKDVVKLVFHDEHGVEHRMELYPSPTAFSAPAILRSFARTFCAEMEKVADEIERRGK